MRIANPVTYIFTLTLLIPIVVAAEHWYSPSPGRAASQLTHVSIAVYDSSSGQRIPNAIGIAYAKTNVRRGIFWQYYPDQVARALLADTAGLFELDPHFLIECETGVRMYIWANGYEYSEVVIPQVLLRPRETSIGDSYSYSIDYCTSTPAPERHVQRRVHQVLYSAGDAQFAVPITRSANRWEVLDAVTALLIDNKYNRHPHIRRDITRITAAANLLSHLPPLVSSVPDEYRQYFSVRSQPDFRTRFYTLPPDIQKNASFFGRILSAEEDLREVVETGL